MSKSNPEVDRYLAEGCGRCALFKTPQCKVRTWETELVELRRILLSCKLTEERKWGVPCYTHEGRNIVILGALVNYCAVGFFKGALLKDPKGLLTAPGENSQAVRQLRFTSVTEIKRASAALKNFVQEAIKLEESGAKVKFKSVSEHQIPDELKEALKKDAVLGKAFDLLTPGRQRGYILFISSAKQSATRTARIKKCRARILEGRGLNEY